MSTIKRQREQDAQQERHDHTDVADQDGRAGALPYVSPVEVEADADRADEIDEWKENCVVKDRVDIRATIFVVDLVERAQRLRLGIEYLNCLRAGKVLLQKSVDARDACAHEVVTSPRAFAKPGSSGNEQRDCQQAEEREPYIHPQHHEENPKPHRHDTRPSRRT